MQNAQHPDPLRSEHLEFAGKPFLRHGFFTRVGGVSEGIYAGLNTGTGSDDDKGNVAENRRRVAQWLGVPPQNLLSVWQVHSADVLVVSEPFSGERPQADAMVTDRRGIAIAASSADCGPILFAEPDAGVIGAAHAGWKGAFTGVLENTVTTMVALGARRDRIVAVLGPSISQANYEVGPEFVDRFTAANGGNVGYFAPSERPGHAMFDLNGYTVDRLLAAGVQAYGLNRCTYAEEDLFFSFRRTTHRGEPDYGRLISAIVMGEE
jgi:YfiH family protein